MLLRNLHGQALCGPRGIDRANGVGAPIGVARSVFAVVFSVMTTVVNCTAVTSAAVQSAPADHQQEGNTGAVEGVVLNAKTGQPVARAVVRLIHVDSPLSAVRGAEVTTDESGRFRLPGVGAGIYRLGVTRRGFSPFETELPPLDRERPERKEIALRLRPMSALAGRVVDQYGEPVPNARVMALRSEYSRNKHELVAAGWALSDDLGQFRVHSLPAGQYFIKAIYTEPSLAADGSGPGGRTRSETTLALYYPGVPVVSDAAAVVLEDGEDRNGFDMRVLPVRLATLKGRIIGPEAGRELTCRVLLAGRGAVVDRSENMRVVKVRPDSSFEIAGVLPGSYAVLFSCEQGGARLSGRRTVQTGTDDLDDIDIVLRAAARINGVVRLEAQPTAAKAVRLDALGISAINAETISGRPITVRVGEDGRFRFREISEGEYEISVHNLPPPFYVKKLQFGEQNISGNLLTISGLDGAATLEITVRGDGGSVEGSVLGADGEKVPGAAVIAISRANVATSRFHAQTDNGGRFAVQGLPPGEYEILAWRTMMPRAWADPDYLQEVRSRATTVTVDSSTRQTIQVTAIEPN